MFFRAIHRIVRGFCSDSRGPSSQQIEYQMKLQRMKNLHREKSFNLLNPTMPEMIKDYEKPKQILYTMDNLRLYSHSFPHYLRKELENPNCQFYELLKQKVDKLWALSKTQVIELICFVSGWNIQLDDEKIIQRWAHNQTFTLDQIWVLLKTRFNLAACFENKILKMLDDALRPEEYDTLFKIINLFRLKQLGDEHFFNELERHFQKFARQLTASNLTNLLVHYTNNVSESPEAREKIAIIVQQRLIALSKFLSADELISILFCYLKMSGSSQRILQELQQRITLTLPLMKVEHIQKLLNLCGSMAKRETNIMAALIGMFFKDKLPKKVLPTLYYLVVENSLFGKDFVEKAEPILIANAFIMEPQQVARCCWAFAIVEREDEKFIEKILKGGKVPNYVQFYKKVQDIVRGGLRQYTVKDVCTIVWALSAKRHNYNGQIWQQIESFLQQQLSKKQATVKDAALTMWAYTNQRPLLGKTLQIIINLLFDKHTDLDTFDVSTACWFFSQLSMETPQPLVHLLYRKHVQLQDQMTILEQTKCLRWFVSISNDLEEDVIGRFLNRLDKQYLTLSYPLLVNLLSLLPAIKTKQRKKVTHLTVMIYNRIQELKRVEVPPSYEDQQIKEELRMAQERKQIKDRQFKE